MNLRVPLTLLALVLAAACEPAGPQPPVAVNHVHATPAPHPTSSASPEPGPTGAPPAAPPPPTPDRCHTAGLAVSAAYSQGAAGTIEDSFRVANTRTYPCVMYGFVGMLMLDGAGQPLPTRVVRNGGIFGSEAGPSSFLLQPAAVATFRAAWSDVTQGTATSCPAAAQLEVTPPDEYDHVVIPVSGWGLAPCGPGGEIDVSPLRAAGIGPA
jgi:hypothetical protein